MKTTSDPVAYVHSFQSLGAVDGPGIRYVIFLQGCPYHCPYCHNPDTQPLHGGTPYTAKQLADRVSRYRSYFGQDGGVTVSGGEPLLQKEFLFAFFTECHARGIRTCLDTAGMLPDEMTHKLIMQTDTVLCDIKYPEASRCREQFGVDLTATMAFLSACDAAGCEIWIRHVIVPGLTDTEENLRAVIHLVQNIRMVKKIELLPFRKLCMEKYDRLGIPFPLSDTPECEKDTIFRLNRILSETSFCETAVPSTVPINDKT